MANRIIISGGGTGGHIFPAIAIANALKHLQPDIEILFVGAEGKMEMERVPEAGYNIVGLDIQGINRKSLWKNVALPFKLVSSLRKANRIVQTFKPQVAVGVGGYASGPLLMAAHRKSIPTLIQEQNSFAGLTNRRLSHRSQKICVAYEGMEKFFPAEKIIKTGNPIRRQSVDIKGKRQEGLKYFDLTADKPVVLVSGGSLGAQSINEALQELVFLFEKQNIQLIWQCGKYYYERLVQKLGILPPEVKLMPFIERMDYAYAVADLVVSRAGAGSISELCAVAKPVILVPSPNVAEDHQSKNAEALVVKEAAIMIRDAEVNELLMSRILDLLEDKKKRNRMSESIKQLALPDADIEIAKHVLNLIG